MAGAEAPSTKGHTGRALRGEMATEVPLAGYTTWRVGGPAERLYRPADRDDLVEFLAGLAEDEPLYWLGLGSNLLVRDGGVRGTVIATSGALRRVQLVDECRVYAEAGVACNKVARFSVQQGLSGGEFLAGIPGTLGGALAMNAGAWGGETWNLVETVTSVDRRGRVRQRGVEAYETAYRRVRGPAGEWFLGAVLKMGRAVGVDPQQGLDRIKDLLARRARHQPTGVASAGSVFRNPPGDYAARLIERSGLKGASLGGARVSEKHANFIVHGGAATAADIEALIGHVMETVEREQGVRLEPEVRIIGSR